MGLASDKWDSSRNDRISPGLGRISDGLGRISTGLDRNSAALCWIRATSKWDSTAFDLTVYSNNNKQSSPITTKSEL